MNVKEKIIDLFYEIAAIPHMSGQTRRLVGYLSKYAQQLGYSTEINNGNLIITIPASEGFEDKPAIIIQGHSDMVGAKLSTSSFDFLNDPLELEISPDKKFLTAKDTTLGADDGIALIYMLMLLEEADTFKHPKIYCVITRDEEVGLIGAKSLDGVPFMDASYFINLDTEAEGVIVTNSSGGGQITGTYNYDTNLVLGRLYEISVEGLTGGHSGGAIANKGAHAAKILAQVLGHLIQLFQIQLVSFDCPGVNNIITSSGKAVFISNADRDKLINSCIEMLKLIAACYGPTDPNIKLNLSVIKETEKLRAFTRQSTGNIIFDIMYIPYGVHNYINGQPAASSNIGSCIAHDTTLEITEHLRFANPNLSELVKNQIIQFFTFRNAQIQVSNYDPPWLRKDDSKLREIAQQVWKSMYHTDLKEVGIHGTLETGLFSQLLPNVDIVSIGPTVTNIHTPLETLDLDSSVRVYKYLKRLIEKIGRIK